MQALWSFGTLATAPASFLEAGWEQVSFAPHLVEGLQLWSFALFRFVSECLDCSAAL